MARRPRVPDALLDRPFSRAQALAAGMTARQLDGAFLDRPFPRVYVLRDHVMTRSQWIEAAALSMPPRARLSHVSRLHAAGLDIGAVTPVHFTVAGDLHLAGPGIRLHRTAVLPPLDDVGVTPAAAFVQYCATATLLEAVVAGDWLLRHRHLSVAEVTETARQQPWRPGAHQVRTVLPLLDAGSMSVKESEVRMLVAAAGLPVPEVNVRLEVDGELIGVGDLLLRCVMLVLEYEGRQHAESVHQFNRDIHRYAAFRRHGIEYLQITNEMVERPRVLVRRVHARLVELGYDGPPPTFGPSWDRLDEPVRRPRRRWR
jgi:hypothetical protein